jgi:hypothetical protein
VHKRHFRSVRQNEFELTGSDLRVQYVHSGGMDLDQYVILSQLRFRHFADPSTIFGFVAI